MIPGGGDANFAYQSYQVFSASDGKRLYAISQPGSLNTFNVYRDSTDSSWRMATDDNRSGGFSHYMDCYDLKDGSLKWQNANVNTCWVGAVGASMTDGNPREWGSWYSQTVYALDGNGNQSWSKSLGGGWEATIAYAGNLRGDGVESLVVGSVMLGGQNNVQAVDLTNGNVMWTYNDASSAGWGVCPMACMATTETGVKQVFAWSGPAGRFFVLNGLDGTKLSKETLLPRASLRTAVLPTSTETECSKCYWASTTQSKHTIV